MQNTIAQPVTVQLLNANATALVTATAKNIPLPQGLQAGGSLWPQPVGSALFLNPGYWELVYRLTFNLTGTTDTLFAGGVSTVTGTLPSLDNGLFQDAVALTTATGVFTYDGSFLVNVPANGLNYFLVASTTFSAGTVTASGYINAYQAAQ